MININILAPINDLGYGVVGTNIVSELIKNGNNVALFPLGPLNSTLQKHQENILRAINNQKNFCYDAPSLKIWHQFAMAESVGYGERIGFPIFELDVLTDNEKHHLLSLDQICVCSKWAMETLFKELEPIESQEEFPRAIKDLIHVIPLGVDTDIFNHKLSKPNVKQCQFLNIGKWETRKGHDILIEVFNRAFEPNDNVILSMGCFNPFYSKEENDSWINLYKNTKMGSRIDILPYSPSQQHLAQIMGSVTCGIFPSRAEGWNLELLEMMAMGKQVIATEYSGHTEYCNEDNSHLIEISETELAYDGKWFHNQGKWATLGEYEQDQLINMMQNIYNTWKEDMPMINEAGIQTAKKFSWENTANKILEVLNYNYISEIYTERT